ncbi:MAG: DUF6252 family protein [Bacteroidales bacterium]|nr:DUF6252 family protein [Bacteroidales bacterium]
MRNRVFIISLLFIGILFIGACGGSSTGPAQTPVMYGLVNSSNWRTSDPHAILTDHTIKVYGSSANGQTIILNVNSPEVGEYNITQNSGHNAEFIPNMSENATRYSTANSSNGSGFIRISSVNEETKTMSGNFNFKAYRLSDGTFKTISDGTFSNVPYKYYNISDTSSFNNIFIFTDQTQQRTASEISAFRNDTALVIHAEVDRDEAWESLTIWMSPTINAGVHYITAEGPVWAKFQYGFYEFQADNGSITIIENNASERKIKGTFFFNYIDNEDQTLSITGGQFEVEYEDLTQNP